MSMTRHWKRSSQTDLLSLEGIAVSVKVCMQATLVVDVAFGIKCCIGALVGGLGAQSGALSEALVH
eukprot:1160777-Pelagomonas_calceolata.AAC.18